MLTVDQYSQFVFPNRFRANPDTDEIIQALRDIFNIHSWPNFLKTDNGDQFQEQFAEWTQKCHIDWKPRSPYASSSNGGIKYK